MNYEEMLNAQRREQLPLGSFLRKTEDRKFHYAVELKPELAGSKAFCEALRRDQQIASVVNNSHQLSYELIEKDGRLCELELQAGNYLTLAQLLNNNPAVVAGQGFIDKSIEALMELTEKLHAQGIYHLCYAPQTVFVRKSDNWLMLLCHGSSFQGHIDPKTFYAGFEDAVAPEVLAGEPVDERSDVYALGRFIEQLLASGDMPFEYKAVVKKATDADPEKRYSSVADMRKAFESRRSVKRSTLMMLGAMAIVGLLIFLYFDLTPEASNVEFVDDTGLVQKEDPFGLEYEGTELPEDMEVYSDPEYEAFADSVKLGEMTDEEFRVLSDSVNQHLKLEDIFRRRFKKEAEKGLSGLYSSENMGSSESKFISHSQTVIENLMEYADKLSEETGLPKDVAKSIASQVISSIQADVQQNVTRYGSMTQSQSDEE
jgi:hypothetical protein